MISHTIDSIGPKLKGDKVKVRNLKNLPKFQIFQFSNFSSDTPSEVAWDKMCKFEMDPTSIVEGVGGGGGWGGGGGGGGGWSYNKGYLNFKHGVN